MEFEKEKTACFSGYRPHKFDFALSGNDKYEKMMLDLLDEIMKAAENGYDTFIIGGAPGWDILCSEVIEIVKRTLPNNIRMLCALPYANFKHSKHFDREWKTRYDVMIDRCDYVINVSQKDSYFSGCYQIRNQFIVDNSSLLICYCTDKTGGTTNTIQYARESGFNIINIANQ